jgi:GNAT superfamily N-acetyltransferase
VTDPLVITPERTKRDRREFLELPYRLYRDHPVWVPPLRMADAALMDRKKNPFFAHAEVEHFLARRGTRVVGRIAAIENRLHNEFHGDRLGFFGWFDVEPDPEAARALVAAARSWCAARGLDAMRGPVNYSTNDVCGALVEGFGHRPALMMPYNREDYDALLKGAGLAPVKDLLAYRIPCANEPPERFRRICRRALERGGYTLRDIDMERRAEEFRTVQRIYNAAWAENWGFVPITDAEFQHAAKDLAMILDPRIFFFVEKAGVPVAFIGPIPDLNEALVGLGGRLFPFGLVKLLLRKRRLKNVRVMLLGVLPEARGRGVDAAIFVEAMQRTHRLGYVDAEAGWILENNHRMRHDIELSGGEITKRYRIYEAPTSGA